jgi:hypothetical protein
MLDDHDSEDGGGDDDDDGYDNNNTLLILGLVHDPSPFYKTINIELPLWFTHVN